MKIEQVAKELMQETSTTYLWYGNPDFVQRVYRRYKKNIGQSDFKPTHPLNEIATVLSQVSRGRLFKRTGYINHLGRDYPVFELK